MSSKTLERRLAEQGESFSALLDRTRFNAVTHYLQDPDMRLTQVAYLAGYTEPAALVRAFKRWTGETPSKFRERPRSSMSNYSAPAYSCRAHEAGVADNICGQDRRRFALLRAK
jgi:AraC-like DNA-binding protein